jgi:hypothetical protein
MKSKAKGKAKGNRKRARTRDLGAKKAGTVKGGIAVIATQPLTQKLAEKW